MKTLAAVLVETKKPLVLAELEIPALNSGQVLVEIAVSGVCHTQLLEVRGHRGEDRFLPHCLGHEGSGVVCEIGPGVTKVKSDDTVILSWMKGSGGNAPGTTYRWDGRIVNSGAISTFSRHAVISENRLTPFSGKLSMRQAALLGCAVPTGVGSVLNTANAEAGQSAAIFGIGGVGLSALAGAAIAGCRPLIAVDVNPDKLKLARAMGATHAVQSSPTSDAVSEILKICARGVDVAVEVTGLPFVMNQALRVVRSQGGRAVIVGNAKHGAMLEIDPHEFNQGKRMLGTWGGDNDPDLHFPRYMDFVLSGKLNLEPFLERVYPLSAINEALDDFEQGRALRPLIEMTR